MKEIKTISSTTDYSAISVGKISELNEFVLKLAPGVEIPGKVFIGQSLSLTGAEISFQSFAAGTETGFYHTHKNHEEVYVFLAGEGEFQLDGNIVPLVEGSVVKVAPSVKRTIRNTGSENLVMFCIQYKADSFSAEDAADGVILQEKVEW